MGHIELRPCVSALRNRIGSQRPLVQLPLPSGRTQQKGYTALPAWRNAISRRDRVSRSKVSHSQMTKTSQPSFLNWVALARSRLMLDLNFSAQYDDRVLGVVVRAQPRWRCQKHPWTNRAFRNLGNTKSGVPGSLRLWRRKRYPNRCASLRTAISGLEFLSLTRAMRAERCGSTGSPARNRTGFLLLLICCTL